MLKDLDSIDGLTDEQKQAINGLASGLISKNEELLGKLTNVKEQTGASQAEIEALKQFKTNAEIKAAEDAKNWEEATRLKEEAWQAEKAKLSEELQAKTQLTTQLLINDGLNNALDSVSVNPALKAGAEAMLKAQATIVDGKAMIGDKTLSEAVKEWAATDSGKAFCLAKQNNGGNANGGDTGQQSNKSWSQMSVAEKAAHLKSKQG